MTVEIPRSELDAETREKLDRIIKAKGVLMKRAFETDTLAYEITGSLVRFPWFIIKNPQLEPQFFTLFITKLVAYAKNTQFISMREMLIIDDRYEFNKFLEWIGLKGKKYRVERKVLLKRLNGK